MADRGGADREAGTTITEVLVVMATTALLGVPLLTLLMTVARVERAQADHHSARIQLDSAMHAVEAELTNATPVASRPAGADATDTLGVLVTDDAANQLIVYWRVGGSGLTRIEADPDTLRVVGRSTIAEAVMAPDSAPFRYYDATGAQLIPGVVGARRLADCTTLVEISLAVDIGDEIETATSRRAIRTRTSGGNGC